MAIYLITPALNSAEYIEKTIESIVAQTIDGALYYHIQDGLSTDGTVAILKKWEATLANHKHITFTYASEPDCGMYAAINKGFSKLDIPEDAFMGWINSDDQLAEGCLHAVNAASTVLQVEWLYGISSCTDTSGYERMKMILYPQILLVAGVADGVLWPFFQQEGCFFRKRLWDAVGGCDISFKLAGDWDLWKRMAQIVQPVLIPQKLGKFIMRSGQLSADLEIYRQEINCIVPRKMRQMRMIRLACCSRLIAPIMRQADQNIDFLKISLLRRCCCFAKVLGIWKYLLAIRSFFSTEK